MFSLSLNKNITTTVLSGTHKFKKKCYNQHCKGSRTVFIQALFVQLESSPCVKKAAMNAL